MGLDNSTVKLAAILALIYTLAAEPDNCQIKRRGRKGDVGPPGIPGRDGVKGDRGFRGKPGKATNGTRGVKGEPGKACHCPNVERLELEIELLRQELTGIEKPKQKLPEDCSDLHRGESGVRTIYPQDMEPMNVMCNSEVSPGGWIVIQTRLDGSVDFYRNWEEYAYGFGNANGEYWLGLEQIHLLTSSGKFILRVEISREFQNEAAYAEYTTFLVASANDNYRLTIDGYSGTAGDSLRHHNKTGFSTYDRDHDTHGGLNCAEYSHGGWWYRSCNNSNLNGNYFVAKGQNGVVWYEWKNAKFHLKTTKMMIRKKGI